MCQYRDANPEKEFVKVELLNHCWRELERIFDENTPWYEKFSFIYPFASLYRLGKRDLAGAINKMRNDPQRESDTGAPNECADPTQRSPSQG